MPDPLRALGLLAAVACLVLYLRSLVSLGPTNTYCRRAGLVERGIYRWTRNPQYATIIPAYAGLALAADSAPAAVLIALVAAVYVLMAYAEEPWLKTAYPGAYERYARRVPRFYNWRAREPFCGSGGASLPPRAVLPRRRCVTWQQPIYQESVNRASCLSHSCNLNPVMVPLRR